MSIKIKGLVVILFFLSMDLGVYLSDGMNRRMETLENEVSQYRIEYESLKTTHDLMQSDYRNTLVNIVRNLYGKESYRNVGGVNDVIEQNNMLLYEAIVNATTPFNSLLENIENYFDGRREYLDNIPSIWPIPQSEFNRITSPFGIRISPFTGETQHHKGIDISGIAGQEVLATATGIVEENWIYHHVYGKMVMINHQNGYGTLYGHLSRSLVREGQHVKRGQTIGIMGSTGLSLGLHLHYEVHKDSELVNPIDYLASNNILVMNK